MWHGYGGSSLFKSLKSGLPHSLNFRVEWMMIWEQWCLELNKVEHFTFDPIAMTCCQASTTWPALLFWHSCILSLQLNHFQRQMTQNRLRAIKITRLQTKLPCHSKIDLRWLPGLFMELPDYTETCFCTPLTPPRTHSCETVCPQVSVSQRSL